MMPTLQTSISDCEHMRADLALYSGGDLDDPASVAKVRGHLAGCAVCRATLTRLTESLDVLQSCGAAAVADSATSLWPALARRLPFRVPSSAAARFNVWVPTAAMTAACAAMILVTVVQLERAALFDPTIGPRNRSEDQTFVDLRDSNFQRSTGRETPVDLPARRLRPQRSTGPFSPDRDW